jgi:hypothetical protein
MICLEAPLLAEWNHLELGMFEVGLLDFYNEMGELGFMVHFIPGQPT